MVSFGLKLMIVHSLRLPIYFQEWARTLKQSFANEFAARKVPPIDPKYAKLLSHPTTDW